MCIIRCDARLHQMRHSIRHYRLTLTLVEITASRDLYLSDDIRVTLVQIEGSLKIKASFIKKSLNLHASSGLAESILRIPADPSSPLPEPSPQGGSAGDLATHPGGGDA